MRLREAAAWSLTVAAVVALSMVAPGTATAPPTAPSGQAPWSGQSPLPGGALGRPIPAGAPAGVPGPRPIAAPMSLAPAASCDELAATARRRNDRMPPHGMAWPDAMVGMAESDDATRSLAGGQDMAASPQEALTGTNVQVEGVDEPDLVDTEGTRMVTVVDGNLRLFDLSGDTPVQVAIRALEGQAGTSGSAQVMLADGLLTMLTTAAPVWDEFDTPSTGPVTTVTTFDVRDDALRRVGTATFDGGLVAARGVDDRVHLVVVDPGNWLWPLPGEHTGSPRMPQLRRPATAGGTTQLVACDDVLVVDDRHAVGTSLVTVVTLDISDPTLRPVGTATIMTSATTVTATADRMVVASQVGWPVMPFDQALPAVPPPAVPPPAVPPTDDRGVVGLDQPIPDTDTSQDGPAPLDDHMVDDGPGSMPPDDLVAPDGPHTQLTVFDLSSDGPIVVATGEVPGQLVDQFATQVVADQVRVVATSGPRGPNEGATASRSALTVLEVVGDRLVPIGRVTDLGVTEQVFSVRFVGDVAWIVTFRQVDPLYAVDLSDPTGPTVRGVLKVPGFSTYLHPLGEARLLGIGQDATEQGAITGLQVSAFDVSDLDDPLRTDVAGIPDANSVAEHDHHGLLVVDDLVVVPVQRWAGRDGRGRPRVGAWVLRHVDGELEEVGTIAQQAPAGTAPHPVDRIVASDDTLWVVSATGVDGFDRASLAHTGGITF